jgi:hypothetical protein
MTATDNLWLPEGPHWDLNIEHHPSGDAGPFTPGHPKIVLHTTESPQQWIDGAIRQFATQGIGTPHLSIGYREGFRFPVVAQFIPFHRTAKTLEHPNGTPETNRARGAGEHAAADAAPFRVPDEAPALLPWHPLHGQGLDRRVGHRRPLPRPEPDAGAL